MSFLRSSTPPKSTAKPAAPNPAAKPSRTPTNQTLQRNSKPPSSAPPTLDVRPPTINANSKPSAPTSKPSPTATIGSLKPKAKPPTGRNSLSPNSSPKYGDAHNDGSPKPPPAAKPPTRRSPSVPPPPTTTITDRGRSRTPASTLPVSHHAQPKSRRSTMPPPQTRKPSLTHNDFVVSEYEACIGGKWISVLTQKDFDDKKPVVWPNLTPQELQTLGLPPTWVAVDPSKLRPKEKSGKLGLRNMLRFYRDRWFVLRKQHLYVYSDAPTADAQPIGVLDLFSAIVQVDDEVKFTLTGPHFPGGKAFYLKAHNPLERAEWCEAFHTAIDRAELIRSRPNIIGSSPSNGHITETAFGDEGEVSDAATTIDLKNWRLGALLGKGAFGEVHLALLRNGKFVAVKGIAVDSKADPTTVADLRNEIDLMASLDHKNVVRYYGSEYRKEENKMYIFLEYIPQGSLSHVVKQFGTLEIETIRSYLNQILTGLSYLHAHDVVHRDIKCDNVLIDKDGTAKLADFGCAKRFDVLCEKKCSTLVGTPYYMAPEVIANDHYDFKADIWSVGCTVIEMLTGKHPWAEFGSPWAAMYHISNAKGPPTGIPDKISPSMKDFLDKCFQRDATKRPTAAQLLQHNLLIESST